MRAPERPGRPTDEDLTARILDAGAKLLIAHGYASLRIEHIARDAQCGKTAIYRRYSDKATLVAAIIRSRIEVGELPDTGAVRTDLLEHALQNQRNQAQDVGNGLRAMFEPEVFPHLWETFFARRRAHGVAIIDRAVARGDLPPDVAHDIILDTIAGLMLYRQALKGIPVTRDDHLAVIDALLAHPPLTAPTKRPS